MKTVGIARFALKALNPFIWLANYFNYSAHLEGQRYCKEYQRYDFSKDLKYF